VQRQFNIVDNITLQRDSHSLKFGIDYRRLSPLSSPALYHQTAVFFGDVSSVGAGIPFDVQVGSSLGATFLLRNLGVFAQDTWRILPRLTMTYGVRWDLDFVPSTLSGPQIAAVTGFDLNDLSKLALAPVGTPPYKTGYHNLAPRLGLAYQLSQAATWGTTIRGGFGLFYDLNSQEVGNSLFGTYLLGRSRPALSTLGANPMSHFLWARPTRRPRQSRLTT
jgi:outer membrane receptor protein involved in Fe transport